MVHPWSRWISNPLRPQSSPEVFAEQGLEAKCGVCGSVFNVKAASIKPGRFLAYKTTVRLWARAHRHAPAKVPGRRKNRNNSPLDTA
jgi:hypothetical protein